MTEKSVSLSGVSMKDVYFLNKAMGLALSSKMKMQHAAIIVKKGKIISWGVNVRKNHPDVCSDPKHTSARHAEAEALRKANTDVEGTTIYVARINKHGQPLLSKPCKNCQEAIEKAGIKRVMWTE